MRGRVFFVLSCFSCLLVSAPGGGTVGEEASSAGYDREGLGENASTYAMAAKRPHAIYMKKSNENL
jgi:hypothetical protein